MAAHDLTVLSAPDFPQVLAQAIDRALDRELVEIARIIDRTLAKVHLVQCYWSDEDCDCRDKATIHDLKSDQEFCALHFRMLEVARG